MVGKAKIAVIILAVVLGLSVFVILGNLTTPIETPSSVPHEGKYGIYALDLATDKLDLIYSTDNEIYTSALRLNSAGDTFLFAMKVDGSNESNTEIFTIKTDGTSLNRITTNSYFDLYPAWSPDDSEIAFLSKREDDLDIYIMNSNGEDQRKLYDSGSHDADIDWRGDTIVFTSRFNLWTIKDDGTSSTQITHLSNAGQWGTANLPLGDYDPRLSFDGEKIVFERLENANCTHGGYNIFTVNVDGSEETRLTSTSYAQGLPQWSYSDDLVTYVVAAINDIGMYDIYVMNADGSNNHNITPSYFPGEFLCYSPMFSLDDSKIFFIGHWAS